MSEIHVSRPARDIYQFEEGLFSATGRAAVAEFAAARRFAEVMSAHRAQPVPASDINAMGLLNEVFQILIRQYELQNPGVFQRGLEWLEPQIGTEPLDNTLVRYLEEFPPLAVYRGEMKAEQYLTLPPAPKGEGAKERSLEELLLLYITNLNPAVVPYQELHDDETLEKTSAYQQVLAKLNDFFEDQPGFGGSGSAERIKLSISHCFFRADQLFCFLDKFPLKHTELILLKPVRPGRTGELLDPSLPYVENAPKPKQIGKNFTQALNALNAISVMSNPGAQSLPTPARIVATIAMWMASLSELVITITQGNPLSLTSFSVGDVE